MNIITGNLKPDTGEIELGVNTKFGYYAQNPVFPDTNLTVLEYIKETAEQISLNNDKKEVRPEKFLEEFGFEGKIQYSPVSTLSGGEKKRLYLVKLLLENPNFLILDEPTNDFDIFTMNILEQFLMNYEGCLLLVSHDRYFMDKTVDSLFILEDNGDISGFVGKCSEYIEFREENKKQKGEASPHAPAIKTALSFSEKNSGKTKDKFANANSAFTASTTPSAGSNAARNACSEPQVQKKKLSFKEQKEFEELDSEIPVLEDEKTQLESQMSTTDFSELTRITNRYNEVTKLLEQKYERWEELAERA